LAVNNHYRNRLPVRILAQLAHKLESVHLGHHQVEQNHARPDRSKPVQPDAAVLSFDHAPAALFEDAAGDFARVRMPADQQYPGDNVVQMTSFTCKADLRCAYR
jgi:hypothetical protein